MYIPKSMPKTPVGKRKFRWQQIYEAEKATVTAGGYPAGEVFTTIADLSEKHGVSAITARRVLRLLEEDGLVRNVQRRGAVVLRHRVGRECHVVMPQETGSATVNVSHIIYGILEGLHRGADAEKIRLIRVSEEFLERPEAEGRTFICFYPFLTISVERLAELAMTRRVVLLHTPHNYAGLRTVRCDIAGGIGMAVAAGSLRGHSRIALMIPRIASMWFQQRYLGYLTKLTEMNIPFDPDLVQFIERAEQLPASVENALNRLMALESPPTLIVCTNDRTALALLDACKKKKIAVPKKCAVVGFDNRHECDHSHPPLTTIDPHLAACGRKAVEIASALADGMDPRPYDVVIKPEIIYRDSLSEPFA